MALTLVAGGMLVSVLDEFDAIPLRIDEIEASHSIRAGLNAAQYRGACRSHFLHRGIEIIDVDRHVGGSWIGTRYLIAIPDEVNHRVAKIEKRHATGEVTRRRVRSNAKQIEPELFGSFDIPDGQCRVK